MAEKIFSEVGIGNCSFFSTEIENGAKEKRIKGFIRPKKIVSYYFRIWILKKVLIVDSKEGIKLKKGKENRIKILIGIHGENR